MHTTIRCHFILSRLDRTKKTVTNAGKDVEKLKISYIVGDGKMRKILQYSLEVPQNVTYRVNI